MSIFMHVNGTLEDVKGKPVWLNIDWWCNRSSRHPCYVLTKHLPDSGKGALMVTETHYDFCTPDEKGGNCCQ